MALTPKLEKFCQCIADGKNQTDAYKTAFNSSRMKPATINNKAYQLMQRDDIRARVAETKAQLEEKALWTREDSVNALKKIAEGDKGSEVVAAVKELNSMHGYNEPKKMELTGKDGGPMEFKALTKEEMIEEAKRRGIPLDAIGL